MTRIRRSAVLLGLTASVIVGSSIPASATFSESVRTSTGTVSTGTVIPPTGLTVDDSCTTITTTVTRTFQTHPVTGAQTQTNYNSTTTRATATSNVQGTETTTAAGPRGNETTTTTTTRNTELRVTLTWAPSPSRGVNGYVVSARLGATGGTTPLMSTTGSTTSVTQVQDADGLAYQPSLLVTAQTSHRWTADSSLTRVLSC